MMPVPPMFLSEYGRRPITPTGKMSDCSVEILKSIGYKDEDIAKMKENKVVR